MSLERIAIKNLVKDKLYKIVDKHGIIETVEGTFKRFWKHPTSQKITHAVFTQLPTDFYEKYHDESNDPTNMNQEQEGEVAFASDRFRFYSSDQIGGKRKTLKRKSKKSKKI